MISQDINITFSMIKNGAYFPLLFVLLSLQEKYYADAHRIICEMYDENVFIIIRTCAN